MTNTGDTEPPMTRLYRHLDAAKARADKLDAWTRDPSNEDAWDWEWHYREMRREKAHANRLQLAIWRVDTILHGTDHTARVAGFEGSALPPWMR